MIDDQIHHLTFSLDEDKNIIVYLDGVRLEGSDKELAVKVFEHGVWFKFAPIQRVDGISQKEISDSIVRPLSPEGQTKGKKSRNRKR